MKSFIHGLRKDLGIVAYAALAQISVLLILCLLQEFSSPEQKLNWFTLKHVDYLYFLHPVDQFFELGTVTYDGKEAFAGRMPGYWFPYLVLGLCLTKPQALVSLIFMQIVFSFLAAICFNLLVQGINLGEAHRRKKLSIFLISAFLFSPFLFPFLNQTITESFSISLIVLFLFFFRKIRHNTKTFWIHGIISGVCLAWLIFLRPFTGLLLLLTPLFLLFWPGQSIKRKIVIVSLVLLPFFVIEISWITRNYLSLDRFIPLSTRVSQYGRNYSDGWQEMRQLIFHLGEGANFFDPGLAEWFRRENVVVFPNSVTLQGTGISITELEELKSLYHSSLKCDDNRCFSNMDAQVIEAARHLDERLRNMDLVRYYIGSHINAFVRLIFSSGSPQVPAPDEIKSTLFYKIVKGIFAIWYYLVLFLGLFFIIWKSRKSIFHAFLLMYLMCLIATLVLYGTSQEPRYFVTGFTVLLIGFCKGLIGIVQHKNELKAV